MKKISSRNCIQEGKFQITFLEHILRNTITNKKTEPGKQKFFNLEPLREWQSVTAKQ